MVTWFSLIPPCLTLTLAIITRRIPLALGTGIISACLIITNFSIVDAMTMALGRVWSISQIGNLITLTGSLNRMFMFLFLIVLGIIIQLLSATGAAHAYRQAIGRKISTAQQAERASIFLSFLLFIDDYLSNLTAGSVMRHITDRFYIPRVKLAFLVNSMAAPLTILSPLSSWVAEITTQLGTAGVSLTGNGAILIAAHPFHVYLQVIPYLTYSFITIASVLFINYFRISYGTMHTHELNAEKLSFAPSNETSSSTSLISFVGPLAVLVFSVLIGLLYTGNFEKFGGSNNLMIAFQSGDISTALFFGSMVALIVSILDGIYRKAITAPQFITIAYEGMWLMLPSIFMLCLAWSFSSLLTQELQTGRYLAQVLLGSVSPLLLPFIFFIVSAIITLTIGSSWGTIALMIALAVPMIVSWQGIATPLTLEQAWLFLPVLGALLSGAVAANTISPIGDATIMAATSTGSSHLEHIKTQMIYSLPPLIGTTVAYLIMGILAHQNNFMVWFIPLALGTTISFGLLQTLNRKRT